MKFKNRNFVSLSSNEEIDEEVLFQIDNYVCFKTLILSEFAYD